MSRGDALGLAIRSVEVRGARTTYIDEGEGPVVLLLHGAPLTSLGFVRVIRELRSTHRVIAPDLPGFGGSELPARFDGTLGAYTDFVVELCSVLGLRDVVLYLNDASGCFGLAAAARLGPETVKGVVVADTMPIPLTGLQRGIGLLLRYVVSSRLSRFLNRSLNLLPWLVVTVAPWLRPFSRAERAVLAGEFDTAEKRERILDLFEHLGTDREFMHAAAESARRRLRDTPALILFGQLDPMRFAGSIRRFRAMFPIHRVVVIPKEEHFPILSSGERIAVEVREWMESLPRKIPGGGEDAP